MSKKPETGTILFEVALLTIVVFLVDEWLIRGALAFIPAMLLAQRALDTAKVPEGWGPMDQASTPRIEGPINKLLGVFREFYSMCHLLGSGGITSDEAHQRTMDLEKDVNQLLSEVTSMAPAAVGAAAPVGPVSTGASPGFAAALQEVGGESPGLSPEESPPEDAPPEEAPDAAEGLPTL